VIEVKNIRVVFGEKIVFDNYSVTLPEKDIYCITGKSGCGKTTLLRVISGLHEANSGEVIVNGKKVIKPSKDIGVVYQKYENFPWLNVLNNVLFPIKMQRKVLQEDRIKAMEILERFGLHKDANKFPHELSGGMNQRLAMSSAIMHNPPVLLMDEPLSALDPENRESLQDFLLEFNKGDNQIVIVTHSNEEAEKLSKGKVIKL